MSEIRKGVCSFCRLGCELGILTDDWKIIGVEYLKGNGLNDGGLCARGNAAAIYLDHPRRLVFPMENGRIISWDETFAKLADLLKKTDSRELAITYDSNLTEEEYSLVWKLAQRLGIENLASSYLEPEIYFGNTLPGVSNATLEDIRKSSVFVLVGDVFNQTPMIARQILEAKYASKSGRIYVIDSYVTHTASFADIFLQVSPGMESLALLGLSILVSGSEGQFPLEKCIECSGVGSSSLRSVANSLTGDEKKAVVAVMALGRTKDPLLLSGFAQYLAAQLPGDRTFLPLGESFSKVGKVEFADILRKIESEEVKVLINFGVVFPHMYPQLGGKLHKLSRFISTAVLKTDIESISGVWLPAALNLEKSGSIDTAFGIRNISSTVAPASGAKSVGEIIERLAAELSLNLSKEKTSIPKKVVELDNLKARADRLLNEKKDDLVLVGEKIAYNFRSFFGEEPYVKLNPIEALRLNAKSGEIVTVKTSIAQTELKLITTDRVPPRLAVVSVESPGARALFDVSIDEEVLCFKPQTVELWKEKA